MFVCTHRERLGPHIPRVAREADQEDELEAMVDFLYYGESNVNQESLDVFLGLAEELKLNGLPGSSNESNMQEFSNQAFVPEKNIEEEKPHVKTTSYIPPGTLLIGVAGDS